MYINNLLLIITYYSLSYLDQILGRRESQTRQAFRGYLIARFRGFETFTKFRGNGQKW